MKHRCGCTPATPCHIAARLLEAGERKRHVLVDHLEATIVKHGVIVVFTGMTRRKLLAELERRKPRRPP